MNTLTREQLKTMNEKDHEDFVIINVLDRDAFDEQHIRTSINIPVDQPGFTTKVTAVVGSKKRPVIVYCASFDCDASRRAAQKLDSAGFEQVFDYEGGMQDWLEHKRAA